MWGAGADVGVGSVGVGNLVAGRNGVFGAGVFDELVVAAADCEIIGGKV